MNLPMPLLCEGCNERITWNQSVQRHGGRNYHPGCVPPGAEPEAPAEAARSNPSRAIILGAFIIALAILVGTLAFPRYERTPSGWYDRWTGASCQYPPFESDLCLFDDPGRGWLHRGR